MRIFLILLLFVLLKPSIIYSQTGSHKELKAIRISEEPKIDGKLSEQCWQTNNVAADFIQFEPYNGATPTFQTRVIILYDDNAVYIGAIMYDSLPGKIMRELGPRDSDELNADLFLVSLSPYNDGLNSFDFFLYASGVQTDVKNFSTGEDLSWDAVWKSEVMVTDAGWVAEIEIPYSALRFPRTESQTWGLNFAREVRRMRETSTWNFVDKKIDGVLNQAGVLTGIENIKPPLRLSFMPYLSSSVLKEPSETNWDFRFNGGMDLKYGISESFTLDMTLIPDFSQVPSDDQVVNLGPFETYYSEKRQFFTEGVELFSRGDVFYSRRVGSEPMGHEAIQEEYAPEDIIENPEQTVLLNATKLSGRTSKGTGLGLFNAFTAPSYATVRDSNGITRGVQTQPFTNYSMLVADQSLPNKSYISLYNTNVYRGTNEYMANVTGTEMEFRDKRNLFSASGLLNVSQKYYPDKPAEPGFLYEVALQKISGNANYAVFREVVSDTYDPNDLGYLESNNEAQTGVFFSYDFYDPFWVILDMHNEISLEYLQLYDPREFTGFDISIENRTQFKNHLTVGLESVLSPVEQRDYFEPRHDGWFVKFPPSYSLNVFYSPDYNKTFLVDIMPGISWSSGYNQLGYYLRLGPRYKVNDHLFMVLMATYSRNFNDIGYVTDSLENNELKIIFGKRDIENITTTLNINYSINPKISFSFRVRHYLFEADYDQYYDLGKDGGLTPNSYSGYHDFIYNSFNIDSYFTWLFAPGSELTLAWKNAIYTNAGLPSGTYFDELANTLEAPASNLISLKLLYYLDYQYFRKLKKKV
jgi:hypothetical protein